MAASDASSAKASDAAVKLMTSDGQIVEVPRRIALMSVTLKHMLEDMEQDLDSYPVPAVSSALMTKSIEVGVQIVEYCVHHVDDDPTPKPDEDSKNLDNIDSWDATFCEIPVSDVLGVMQAANYLDIHSLLVLTTKTIANLIKGKTVEEIRKTFSIVNDFTPEEEEQVRLENEWCEAAV